MDRIYHTWDEWECYPAGFYDPKPPEGMSPEQARREYAAFLRDSDRFRGALQQVLSEWVNSCEHYLSNERMNRIAWLGQAAMCRATGVSSEFRSGYGRLTKAEQARADQVALEALNQWLSARGEPPLPDLAAAKSRTQANLY